MENNTSFEQAIASLGTTSQTIGDALRAKGIKGKRNSCTTCPIAEYLKACGFDGVVVVGTMTADHFPVVGKIQSVNLPDSVQNWIASFDNDAYKEFSC